MKKIIIAITLLNMVAYAKESVSFKPKNGYLPTVETKYVDASADRVLGLGEKIKNLTELNLAGKVVLQKISAHSYWVQTGFYNSVFYVGNEGVLVIDPLGFGAGNEVIKAIKSVTNKPIKALILSHAHADHIADTSLFIENAKKDGVDLKIISSKATAAKLTFLKSHLPKANILIDFNGGEYKFENQTIKVIGFDRAAHTDDSSAWLLVEEKVIHAPDLTNPDQMPYLGFGGSENYTYLKSNLETIKSLDWTVFSGGHGNIGSKKDIEFNITYLDDLRASVKKALEKISWESFAKPAMNNHQAIAKVYQNACVEFVKKDLRPKYGKFYGYEASIDAQAELALESISSYQ